MIMYKIWIECLHIFIDKKRPFCVTVYTTAECKEMIKA